MAEEDAMVVNVADSTLTVAETHVDVDGVVSMVAMTKEEIMVVTNRDAGAIGVKVDNGTATLTTRTICLYPSLFSMTHTTSEMRNGTPSVEHRRMLLEPLGPIHVASALHICRDQTPSLMMTHQLSVPLHLSRYQTMIMIPNRAELLLQLHPLDLHHGQRMPLAADLHNVHD